MTLHIRTFLNMARFALRSYLFHLQKCAFFCSVTYSFPGAGVDKRLAANKTDLFEMSAARHFSCFTTFRTNSLRAFPAF